MLKEKILALFESVGRVADPVICSFGKPVPALAASIGCQILVVVAALDGELGSAFVFAFLALVCASLAGFSKGYDVALDK